MLNSALTYRRIDSTIKSNLTKTIITMKTKKTTTRKPKDTSL